MVGQRSGSWKVWLAFVTLAAATAVSGQEPERRTCALVPFHSANARPESRFLGTVIQQALRPALMKMGTWQMLERERVAALLAEADLKAADLAAGRPGKLAGADLLIIGECLDDQGLVTVSARLVGAATGEVVREATWAGHVSGLRDEMPPVVAAALAGRPAPRPDLLPEMQNRFERACRAFDRGRIDQAVQLCTDILDRHPRHVATLLLRGTAQLEKKGWSRAAAKDFEAILDQEQEHAAARIGLARVHLGGDEREAAKGLRLLADVLADEPAHGEAMWWAAQAHARLGRTAEAIRFAEQATHAMPEFGPAWQTLAQLQLTAGSRQGALKSAQEATTHSPKDPAAWMLLGDVQRAAGDRAAARASFRTGLGCEPPPLIKNQLEARLGAWD